MQEDPDSTSLIGKIAARWVAMSQCFGWATSEVLQVHAAPVRTVPRSILQNPYLQNAQQMRGLEMENAVISDHPFVGQYCTAHTYAFHVREICCCPQLPAPAGLPPTGTVPYCWCKLVATSDRCPSRDGGRHGRRTVALSQFGVCTTSHTTANAKPFALRTWHAPARPAWVWHHNNAVESL